MKIQKLSFVVILISILLSGCTVKFPDNRNNHESSIISSATIEIDVQSISAAPTKSMPLEGEEIISKETPIDLGILETPIPTVSPQLVVSFLENIFDSRVDCQLPCWGGIVPGETYWAEANQYISSIFGEVNRQTFENDEIVYYWSQFYFKGEILRIDFGVIDNIISFILIKPQNQEINYSILDIINILGEPIEVRIAVFPRQNRDVYYLIYPEKGIIMKYIMNLEVSTNKVTYCNSLTDPEEIWNWDPERHEEYMENNFGNWQEELKTIDIITGILVEDFHEKLQFSDGSLCFSFPLDDFNPYPDYGK